MKVEKNYVFDGPNGKETLADLFAGRSQLIVCHFMFGPDAPGWPTEGCVMCSFLSDHIDGAPAASGAPRRIAGGGVARTASEGEPYRERMGWHFKWVSSNGSDFNRDYHVSFTKEDIADGNRMYNYKADEKTIEGEAHGISVFYKDARATKRPRR